MKHLKQLYKELTEAEKKVIRKYLDKETYDKLSRLDMNIEKAKELLKYSVQRNTPERYIVLDVVFQLNKFTKIQLTDKVRELKNRVSAATVYNSINIFENLGIIEHKRGDVYSVTPDSAILTELSGLKETITLDLAEIIEDKLSGSSKIDLIHYLYGSLLGSDVNKFIKSTLEDQKECEQEFDNREEVLKAFDVVINSIK